jgi:hypothetical protein
VSSGDIKLCAQQTQWGPHVPSSSYVPHCPALWMSTLTGFQAMADLRQRTVSTEKSSMSTEKQKTQDNGTSIRARSSISGYWHALLCIVSTCAFFLLFKSTPLAVSPTSYAVCSREGPRIYTLDDSNPLTQCLVVQGSHIADSGTLGIYYDKG